MDLAQQVLMLAIDTLLHRYAPTCFFFLHQCWHSPDFFYPSASRSLWHISGFYFLYAPHDWGFENGSK
jgi:hypothetical protein